MSYEQIADVLECNLGTVRSRIFHAKLALRKEMERPYDR
jgi:DNA-directed RNA polymerase specialized sigma24 family protein